MRQRETDGDLVTQTVGYEIYLKGREEPVRPNATFEIDRSVFSEGSELNDFMQIVVNHALQTIDVVREHRLILSDERFNKAIFLTDHIQAISILAPDEDTFLRALEN